MSSSRKIKRQQMRRNGVAQATQQLTSALKVLEQADPSRLLEEVKVLLVETQSQLERQAQVIRLLCSQQSDSFNQRALTILQLGEDSVEDFEAPSLELADIPRRDREPT